MEYAAPAAVSFLAAEIVVGRAHARAVRSREGGAGLGAELGLHTAVVAHLDQAHIVGVREERVVVLELRDDALDRGFHAEELAALDAGEGLFGLLDLAAEGLVRQLELGAEFDRGLGADIRADAALDAGFLAEAELRAVRIVHERAGGAEARAGEAEGAGAFVHDDRAVGGAFGERQGGVGHAAGKGLGGEAHAIPPPA